MIRAGKKLRSLRRRKSRPINVLQARPLDFTLPDLWLTPEIFRHRQVERDRRAFLPKDTPQTQASAGE